MSRTATPQLREQLTTAEQQLSAAKDGRAEARTAYDAAAEKLGTDNSAAAITAARDARLALEAAQTEVEQAEERRGELLARLAHENGQRPTARRETLDSDDSTPGAWLSRICLAASTTDDIGSKDATDRLFFDRLAARSALLSSGLQVVDIDTSSIDVGVVTGDMSPAVPVAEGDLIAKDDFPLDSREIKPPKFPKLAELTLEAYRDARPIKLAAAEGKMVQAIGLGFDAAGFHGAAASLHPGLEHTTGIGTAELTAAMANLDVFADAIGELLDASASPAVLYINPTTVRELLKLKKDTDSNEPLVDALQNAASQILGVPVYITKGVALNHAFMVDPRTLVIVRRSDVETAVFEGYDVDHAIVGVRAIARLQLVVADPQGVCHIDLNPAP